MISRAERRLEIDPEAPAPPRAKDRAALEKLVLAIEQGEIDTVVAMLDRDAVLWADGGGKVKSAMNRCSEQPGSRVSLRASSAKQWFSIPWSRYAPG